MANRSPRFADNLGCCVDAPVRDASHAPGIRHPEHIAAKHLFYLSQQWFRGITPTYLAKLLYPALDWFCYCNDTQHEARAPYRPSITGLQRPYIRLHGHISRSICLHDHGGLCRTNLQHIHNLIMKTTHTLLLGTAFAVALSSCDSTYSDWSSPGVIKRSGNQMSISPRSQVQPTFPKPKAEVKKESPKPAAQVQPEFKKDEPKRELKPATPQVQPEPQKSVSEPALKPIAPRSTQVQPEFVQPTAAPVKKSTQVQPELSQPRTEPRQLRPVMTPSQREVYPVMPGQNRALKRRR